MAVTISLYNDFTANLIAGFFVATKAFKLELLNATATFNAVHTTKTQVDNSGAYEVSGNGWDLGGEPLANVSISTVTTNDAKLDADDVRVTATGGDIGPASKALLYQATDGKLVAFIDFGESKTAGVGTDFLVQWSTDGILQVVNAA